MYIPPRKLGYKIQTGVWNLFQRKRKPSVEKLLFIENYETITSKRNKIVKTKWWKIDCTVKWLVFMIQSTLSYLEGSRGWHFAFLLEEVIQMNNHEIGKIIVTKNVISCLWKRDGKDAREVFWRQLQYYRCSLEVLGRNSKICERIILFIN